MDCLFLLLFNSVRFSAVIQWSKNIKLFNSLSKDSASMWRSSLMMEGWLPSFSYSICSLGFRKLKYCMLFCSLLMEQFLEINCYSIHTWKKHLVWSVMFWPTVRPMIKETWLLNFSNRIVWKHVKYCNSFTCFICEIYLIQIIHLSFDCASCNV